MLGPLQMLAYADTHLKFLRKIWHFVKEDKTKFPLSASMIGMTKIAVEVLRQGKINSLINKKNSVVGPFN